MKKEKFNILIILTTITVFSLIGFAVTLAAISIQNDLDFGESYGILNLRDLLLTPTSTPPSCTEGRIYYSSSDNRSHICDDSGWTELGGGTATGDFVSKTGDTMTGKLTISLDSDDMLTFVRSGTTEQYTLALGTDGTLALKNETGIVRLRIDSSGNIGIGTTTPFSRLHIKDGQTWGTDISLEATDGTRWLLASTNNTAAEGPGKFLIKDNNVPDGVRMIIDGQNKIIDIKNSLIKNIKEPVDDQDAVTKYYVDKSILPGIILMYNGTGITDADIRTEEIGARPGDLISMPGWYVCNGQSSTPDLRNKFIRSESQAGNTGGSDDAVVVAHTHTGIADLDGAHTHTGVTDSAGEHTHTGIAASAGSHSHGYPVCGTSFSGYQGAEKTPSRTRCYNFYTNPAGAHSHSATINPDGAHSHTLSINGGGSHTHNLTINSEGVDGTGKNMPSYYSLILIMKDPAFSIACGFCGEPDGLGGCRAKLAGEYGLPACQRCDGVSLSIVNIPQNEQDQEGVNVCDNTLGTCYACNGSGNCSFQTLGSDTGGQCDESGCYTGDCSGIGPSCGYQNEGQDLWNACDVGGCNTGFCSGTGYSCGYYTSGKQNCPLCKECDSGGACVNQSSNEDLGNDCPESGCYTGLCNGSGSCEYQDSDQDLWNACNLGGCNTGYCSGSGYSCGTYSCSTCQQCAGDGSSCTASPNTNWGANQYGCSGSDKRCYNGSCEDCSDNGGYLYSDGCSGCAGQGGNGCWYQGGRGQSCSTVCSGHGGCVAANWNDPSNCPVCNHFQQTYACCQSTSGSGWDTFFPGYEYGMCGSGSWDCMRRQPSTSQQCGAAHGDVYRQCVCQY